MYRGLRTNADQPDSDAPLLFEGAQKVVHGQCADNVQSIIEQFEQHAVYSAHTAEHHAAAISGAFPMRLAWWSGSIAPGGAHFLEYAVRLVETMLAMNYQRVSERQLSMQENLLVCGEFENEVHDFARHIDVEHGKYEMLEVAEFIPAHVSIIEGESGCFNRDGSG